MKLPAYLKPIDITQEGASEEIKRMGELARAMISYDLICEEHGLFAQEILKENLEREETRHRNKEHCWHEIKPRKIESA